MITITRDVNCGELYAFVCESKIEDNKEYLIGKESRFLNMDIVIRQNDKKEPYLIIYNDNKEIGALWEQGGYIYINGHQYKALLNKINDTFILEVNLFDDADTLYHKGRVREERLEAVDE